MHLPFYACTGPTRCNTGCFTSQLPEFNIALGDNGLKRLRDAKNLTNADSPSAAVVDEANSILNVARATQFVWPAKKHPSPEREYDVEDDGEVDSEIHGVHPLLTDPKWAPTFLSMARIVTKTGLKNWELLVASIEKRYSSNPTNSDWEKEMLELFPHPSQIQAEYPDLQILEESESGSGDPENKSAMKLSIPLLAFLYVKVRWRPTWWWGVTNLRAESAFGLTRSGLYLTRYSLIFVSYAVPFLRNCWREVR